MVTFTGPKMKMLELANSIDLEEVALNEQFHLDLHYPLLLKDLLPCW